MTTKEEIQGDQLQSRKRNAEPEEIYNSTAKKLCQTAGAVIGKDGKSIFQAQEETKTKVKMSKKNEFYPGTMERVCIVSGTREAVLKMNAYIMEKILEKPETGTNKPISIDGRVNVERHNQVKILVPNSTAGMIIGKNGSLINEIKQKSGAYIQLSQKPPDFNLTERCIIVAGEFDQNQTAVDCILGIIALDPQSGSCNQLIYHDITSPVSSVFPTGSPFAGVCSSPLTLAMSGLPINFQVPQNLGLSSHTNNLLNVVDQNFLPFNGLLPTSQSSIVSTNGTNIFNQLKSVIDYSNMKTQTSASILGTPTVINSANIGNQFSSIPSTPNITQNSTQKLSHNNNASINSQHHQQDNQTVQFDEKVRGLNSANQGNNNIVDPLLAATFLNHAFNANMLTGPLTQRSSSSVQSNNQLSSNSVMGLLGNPTNGIHNQAMHNSIMNPLIGLNQIDFNLGSLANSICCEKEILIPESLVGIILGPQGQTIVNLQTATNTTIKISKKGVYRPGTQDRIVTITGLQVNVQKAVQLIEFNVQSEKLRRQGIIPQITQTKIDSLSDS